MKQMKHSNYKIFWVNMYNIRYIYEVFGIWQHTEEELYQFHKIANSIHPQIQLDLKLFTSHIEFLDVLVEVQENC